MIAIRRNIQIEDLDEEANLSTPSANLDEIILNEFQCKIFPDEQRSIYSSDPEAGKTVHYIDLPKHSLLLFLKQKEPFLQREDDYEIHSKEGKFIQGRIKGKVTQNEHVFYNYGN